MSLPLRAVLVDLDGTLLDAAPDMVGRAMDLLDWLDAGGRA
jgi:phosphoglycolate phosphatase-like HAD superfamily hydrolase